VLPEDDKWTVLENMSPRLQMTSDLFDKINLRAGAREQIGDDACILRGRDLTWKAELPGAIDAVS
jgi:hypothetical protein